METSKGSYPSRSEKLAVLGRRPKQVLEKISPQSRFYWARLLLETPSAVVSLIFIVTIIVTTITVPPLSEQDPDRINPTARL